MVRENYPSDSQTPGLVLSPVEKQNLNTMQINISMPFSYYNPLNRMNRAGAVPFAIMPPKQKPVQVNRAGVEQRRQMIGGNGQVTRIPISDSKPDSESIVATIQQLSEQYAQEPQIRSAALAIVGQTTNNNVGYQVQRIFDWVKRRVTYVQDPVYSEWIVSPLLLLGQIQRQGYATGDCDDHVLLLNSLLGSLGIRTLAVAVKLGNSPYYNHVISGVLVGGIWTDLDPCAKEVAQPRYTEKLIPA